jgi:hypothetical protein
MPITPYLKSEKFDPETSRVMDVALEGLLGSTHRNPENASWM